MTDRGGEFTPREAQIRRFEQDEREQAELERAGLEARATCDTLGHRFRSGVCERCQQVDLIVDDFPF